MSNKHAWEYEITIKGSVEPGMTPRDLRTQFKNVVLTLPVVSPQLHIDKATLTMHRVVHGSQTIETDLTKE